MSINLTTVTSGYNLQAINSNFSSIAQAINDSLLWRKGTLAGESKMSRDLDMDGHRILNADIDASSLTNDRAIRVSTSEGAIPALPNADDRKGKVLSFDANTGLPIVVAPASGSAVDVLNQLSLPTGASLVGTAGGVTAQQAFDSLESKITGLQNSSYKWDNFTFIEDYYLPEDGADWGPAFNRAFSANEDSVSFTIQLRARDYQINTAVSYTGSAAISVVGQNGTKLYFDVADLSVQSYFSIVSVRRIFMQNFQVDAIGKAGSHIVFHLDCTGQDRAHTLENIITTATVSAGQGIIMFDIIGPALSSVQDCHVRYFGEGRVAGSNNIAFRMSAYGGKVSTDSRFESCNVIGPEIAFLVSLPALGSNTSLEGVLCSNCTVVGALDGVRIIGDSNNYRPPMMRWIGGHIMAYSTCFLISHASQIHIDHAFYYLEYNALYSGAGGRSAVNILDSEEVYINNLSIHMFYVPDGSGTGITIGDGSNVVNLDSIMVFADRGVYSVTGVPGSKNVRAFNCCVSATGISPKPSSLNLLGTATADLGGNHILP